MSALFGTSRTPSFFFVPRYWACKGCAAAFVTPSISQPRLQTFFMSHTFSHLQSNSGRQLLDHDPGPPRPRLQSCSQRLRCSYLRTVAECSRSVSESYNVLQPSASLGSGHSRRRGWLHPPSPKLFPNACTCNDRTPGWRKTVCLTRKTGPCQAKYTQNNRDRQTDRD